MKTETLKIEQGRSGVSNVLVVRLPDSYDIKVSAEFIKLAHSHELKEVDRIVIDGSQLQHMSNFGGEIFILRDEFVKMGKDGVFGFGFTEKWTGFLYSFAERAKINPLPLFRKIEDALIAK